MMPESPVRHLSTLEGRKLRRQLSSPAGSSFLYEDCTHSAASSSPASSHNVGHNRLEERDGSGQNDSTGHAAQIFGAQTDFPAAKAVQGLVQGGQGPGFFAASPTTLSSVPDAPTFTPQTAVCDTVSQTYPEANAAASQEEHFFEQNGPTTLSCSGGGGGKGIVLHRTSEVLSPALIAQTVPAASVVKPPSPSTGNALDEQASPVLRQAFVAYTGWASQLANGTIWIRYNEGTQLGVTRNQTEVVYVDQEGNRHR